MNNLSHISSCNKARIHKVLNALSSTSITRAHDVNLKTTKDDMSHVIFNILVQSACTKLFQGSKMQNKVELAILFYVPYEVQLAILFYLP